MGSQQRDQSIPIKEGVILALRALRTDPLLTVRRAAAIFEVPRSTLGDRCRREASGRVSAIKMTKLTSSEEAVIVRHVLDLDSRGFPPTKALLRDMADKLLEARGGEPIGIRWPDNFVKRTPELKTRWTRRYDRQRALTEDPEAIGAWFDLVAATRAQYGILDADTYNFDETGFMMGVVSSQLVVTGSHRRGRPKLVQPGGRTWTTVIQGVGAEGVAIPPYIIFAGKTHLNTWYEGSPLPRDWMIGVSPTGWTTNSHGIAWLRHFDQHTRTRTIASHRLLLIDGHESHVSMEFQDFCAEAKIITLCMPPHSSHLLQPLDVGWSGPLKRAYGAAISDMGRHAVTHITKNDFLEAFQKAYSKAITPDNIKGSFRGSGLIPFSPEVVISRLDVRLRTPSPPVDRGIAVLQTPRNTVELQSQSTELRDRIRRHQDSSPTALIESVDRFTRGAAIMAHQGTLMTGEAANLRRIAEVATNRKSRKRRFIQNEGALTIEGGSQLAMENAGVAEDSERRPAKRTRVDGAEAAQRHCSRCHEAGHYIRTCPQDPVATEVPEQ